MKVDFKMSRYASLVVLGGVLSCLTLLPEIAVGRSLRVGALACEYLRKPIGVDRAQPRLSWIIESETRGEKQTAYQVLVASSSKLLDKEIGDLWDSGRVESDQSIHVPYGGPSTLLRAGKPLESLTRCYWKVRVWDKDGKASRWSELSEWTMGLLKPSGPASEGSSGVASWQAKWIAYPNPKRIAHPWMRRNFECPPDITRAIIHVDTGSFYELHINGKKVGPYVLTPGMGQTTKRFAVMSYDVTSLLQKGTNCIAFWMGPGWHQPPMGNGVSGPMLRAQLDMMTPAGRSVVGTDASWRVKQSCISQLGTWSWNKFGGESFDAREFVADWDQVGLNDTDWILAREIQETKLQHSWLGCEGARLGTPVKAVSIRQLKDGRWIMDFGRLFTGWMRLRLHNLEPGQEVTIRYADSTRGDWFQDFNQYDIFISAGKGEETFCSHFNYHSFQYAVIGGLVREPALEDAEAMMIEPDLDNAGTFECSIDLFNRIHEVTRHTLRTQNPCLALGGGEAREKSAYGDGGAHLSGYLYNFACAANLSKWIRDWRDAQREDGWFPHTAPAFEDHGGGPAWGGQASELVRRMLVYYGDTGMVEQMYERLRKYVDYLESKTRDGILRSFTPTTRKEEWMFIGDWARPAPVPGSGFNMDTKEEREFFNNCYRVLLWQQLHDFARSIGRTDEVSRCAARLAELRTLVHKTFYQPDKGSYVFRHQSALAMALYAAIPPPELRPAILGQLEEEIVVNKKGHLDTGLLGTFVLLDLLIRENRNDLVALIMGQTTYPGWGYLLEELKLNVWPETWSGWGSHVILVTATPGAWFFEGLGGILPDPEKPGFKHFTLRPAVVKDVDWVKCSYQSPYGKIGSNWKLEKGSYTWEVRVPVNATATVYIPTKAAADALTVTESGRAIGKAKGVKFLGVEKGAAVYEVGSGVYCFKSEEK